MSTIKTVFKKIVTSVRPVLLSILAIFLAGIFTTIFHLIFTPFLDPFPQEALMSADWAGKVAIMDAYMKVNPFAVYSALIAHGMGAFAGVYFVTRSNLAYDRKNNIVRPQWIGPLIVAGFWMFMDIQNDLRDAPIGPAWTALDVVVTAVLSFLAYLLAGGTRKARKIDEFYKG